MNKCPKCKTKLTQAAKFCYSCGFKLPEVDAEIDHDLEFLKRNLEPQFSDIKKIGQGGMGSIFLGVQASLNRPVVIKLLNASLALDKKISENFLKEAQIAANLKHPNIVEMVDYGKAEGRPFFIMEYGEAGSLEKELLDLKTKHKKIPSLEVCKLMITLLTALDFAHSKDLKVHRDIKPHNIIRRESGDVFITDFGIALRKDEKLPNNSESAGSIEYMSPEQIKGSKDIDQKSDIYSMGILFFELLTCSLPFESIDKEKIPAKHLNEEIPDLLSRFSKDELLSIEKEEVPILQLQSIIRKACEKDKTKRYSTCKEMADEINSIVQKIAEENTVSFKSHRRKLTVYEFILCALLVLVSYPSIKSFYKSHCTNCCVEGNCVDSIGKFVKDSETNYEGQFSNGEPHGYGIATGRLNDGNFYKYIGKFEKNKFSGDGTVILMSDKNPENRIYRYSGGFEQNKRNGKGSFYFFKEKVYFIGNFKDDKPIGEGIRYNALSGELYKGTVKYISDKNKGPLILADGKGTLITSSGKIIPVIFENGIQK